MRKDTIKGIIFVLVGTLLISAASVVLNKVKTNEINKTDYAISEEGLKHLEQTKEFMEERKKREEAKGEKEEQAKLKEKEEQVKLKEKEEQKEKQQDNTNKATLTTQLVNVVKGTGSTARLDYIFTNISDEVIPYLRYSIVDMPFEFILWQGEILNLQPGESIEVQCYTLWNNEWELRIDSNNSNNSNNREETDVVQTPEKDKLDNYEKLLGHWVAENGVEYWYGDGYVYSNSNNGLSKDNIVSYIYEREDKIRYFNSFKDAKFIDAYNRTYNFAETFLKDEILDNCIVLTYEYDEEFDLTFEKIIVFEDDNTYFSIINDHDELFIYYDVHYRMDYKTSPNEYNNLEKNFTNVENIDEKINYAKEKIDSVLNRNVIYTGFLVSEQSYYMTEEIRGELDKLNLSNSYIFTTIALGSPPLILYDMATDRIVFINQIGILIEGNTFTHLPGISAIWEWERNPSEEELKNMCILKNDNYVVDENIESIINYYFKNNLHYSAVKYDYYNGKTLYAIKVNIGYPSYKIQLVMVGDDGIVYNYDQYTQNGILVIEDDSFNK